MRIRVPVVLAVIMLSAACSAGGLFRQYEYEEDIYLSLDGSATVYVNGSLAALKVLRAAPFDSSPGAAFDRQPVRDWFAASSQGSPDSALRVTRTSSSRRNGRRFAHVRLDVADVRKLGDTAPFAWSAYEFARDGNLFVYKQTVGAAPAESIESVKIAGDAGWTGRELVAFRLHLPSKIVYHNAGVDNFKRGNILVWEQSLADRLKGEKVIMDARMETQSILYRALWLFGATFIAVALLFVLVIVWILRRASPAAPGAST